MMTRLFLFLFLFLFFGLLTVPGPAALAPPPPETGDDDGPEFRRLTAQRSLRENCLICHADDLITTQRLTPKQWKAEVEKMVGWGSPVPKEQQQALIDYLTTEYPADAPAARLASMTYAKAVETIQPDPDDRVARDGEAARGASAYVQNCANCHGPDGRGAELGPNLIEKPVLWRLGDYTEVVRRGRGRMPGFAPLLNARAEADILAWLRTRPDRNGD